MINILLTSSCENFNIKDLKLNKYENVSSYKYSVCKPELLISYNNIEDVLSNKDIYYIFDCPGLDAFAHWFYESFIFYNNIIELTKLYPTIKILTNNKKKYVKSLFRLFNITNEIIYHETDYLTEKYMPNNNNISFFSKILSLNDPNTDLIYYEKLINELIIEINNKIPISLISNNILLLPRNKVDNYASNDRILFGIEDIEKNLIELGGIVLDTYSLNNFYYQFMIIKNSDIIILDFGSSYLVNAIFLKNKKIIILNNYGWYEWQTREFITIKLICDIIIKNNNVIIVGSKNYDAHYIDFSDISNYI